MAKKQRIKAQKDSPDLIKARSSWTRGRFEEALHRFEKALRRQPNHPMALIDAARAFGSRYQPGKAAKILARLEKLAAGRPDELVEAAQAYDLGHRPLEAIRCLEGIIRTHPDHPAANRELAALLERRLDLGRADEHIERYLRGKPDCPDGSLIKARILIARDDPDFAYAILVKLTEPGVRPPLRAEAYSLTARIQESEGEYAEAFESMMEGNQVMDRVSAPFREEAERLEPILTHLRDSVELTHLQRWAKLKETPAEQALPVSLMTSPHRSGATLLSHILARNPQITVSEDVAALSDEVFPTALTAGEDSGANSTELFKSLTQPLRQRESLRYRQILVQCLAGAPQDGADPRLLIDKSPAITPLISAFLRIVPSGKLIVPVRDPRDVLVSSLFSYLPVNRHTVAFLHPFEAAQRLAFEIETWAHFRRLLDTQQWLEVRYEAVVADEQSQANRASDFLGLDRGAATTAIPAEPWPLRLPLQNHVMRPIHKRSVGRWKHYQEQLGSYFGELETAIELLDYD